MNLSKEIEDILEQGKIDGDEEYRFQIGLWDCPACSTVGIPGPVKTCYNCGHNKDQKAEELEYCPEDQLYYNKSQIAMLSRLKFTGKTADWICEFCNTVTNSDLLNCTNCNASKSSQSTEVVEYELDRAPKNLSEAKEGLAQRKNIPNENDQNETGNTNLLYDRHQSNVSKRYVALCLIVVLGLVSLVYYLFFASYAINAKVVSMKWERSIGIEHKQLVINEGWTVPADGKIISQKPKIYNHDKVYDRTEYKTKDVTYEDGFKTESKPCGKIKKGNGIWETQYCEEKTPIYKTRQEKYAEKIYKDVPIYKTWYVYQVMRWQYYKDIKRSGFDKNMFWPKFEPTFTEREISRNEILTVAYESAGKQYEQLVDQNLWNSLEVGNSVKLTVNNIGAILQVNY